MTTYTICPTSGTVSRLQDALTPHNTILIQHHPLFSSDNQETLHRLLRKQPSASLLASTICHTLTTIDLLIATPQELARLNIGITKALTLTQLQSILDCCQQLAPIAHRLPKFSGAATESHPVEAFTQYLITMRDEHKVTLRLSWVMSDITRAPIRNGYRISSTFASGAPSSDYKRKGPQHVSYSLSAILPRLNKSIRQIAAKTLGAERLTALLNMLAAPETLTDHERQKLHDLLLKIRDRGLHIKLIGKRSTLKVSYDTMLNLLAPDTPAPEIIQPPSKDIKAPSAPKLSPITIKIK